MSRVSSNKSNSMSRLEQLARQRAQAHAKSGEILPNNGSGQSNDQPTKMSLKDRLAAMKQGKASTTINSIKKEAIKPVVPKLTLAERLKQNKKESSKVNVHSLTSKLDILRKKQNEREDIQAIQQETLSVVENPAPMAGEVEKPQNNIALSVTLDWKKFQQLQKRLPFRNDSYSSQANEQIQTGGFIDVILDKKGHSYPKEYISKKRQAKIHSIVQPSDAKRQKIVIDNFTHPSPDDIIIQAQTKVFEEVTSNIADLNINPKKDDTLELPTKPRILIDVDKYLKEKPRHLQISILGHHNSGKSTLMGRLLMDQGAIKMEEIRILKNKCERLMIEDKNTFLTWISDTTNEERKNGHSDHIHNNRLKILPSGNQSSGSLSFSVMASKLNTTTELISTVANSDVVVMVIDCSPDGFEQGFNLNGQTIEHSIIAKLCGIKNIIVVLNKMDTVDWYQGRFNEIVNELQMFYQKLGFSDDTFHWIPVSSVTGEGIVQKQTLASWYQDTTLIELLRKQINILDTPKQSDNYFSLSIKEIDPLKNEIKGWITNGNIQNGESITIYPITKNFVVDEINNNLDKKQIGISGSLVTLRLLSSKSKPEKNLLDNIEIGDYATSIISPVTILNSKTVRLEVIESITKLSVGMKLLISRGMYSNSVKILKLNKKSRKGKAIIECELLREDTIPYFSQGNQKENKVILQSASNNRTIGLSRLLE